MTTDVNMLNVPEIKDWCRTERAGGYVTFTYLQRAPGQRYWRHVELIVHRDPSDTVELSA